jgi:glycosyltransferase involved in cell wall biosynthesis
MNVAYLSNSSQIGGGEKCMESLFQGLKGTGIEPFVICPDQGPFVAVLEKMGVKVFIKDLASPSLGKPWGTVRDFQWLRRFLREHDIALFHANGSMGGRKATLACRATGTPLICHIHYPLPLDYYRWVYRRLPAPDSVVFVCDALQRDLGDVLQGAYPFTRQEVIYNGIDTGVYAPKDVDNKVPRIGIIANLQAVKGHEDFLDMASLLVKAGYDASFELIGGDVQNQGRKAVLENRARELGILDKVKFWGFVGDVIAILQDLDIIVCSSHEEASPRCIIESMSCRKPIVATRVNGIPDVVEDGVTGLLVPAHEPASLFGAVKRLLDDPSLRRSLGYGGWKKVNERYSLQAYTGQVVALYGQALKRKQGADAGRPAKVAA